MINVNSPTQIHNGIAPQEQYQNLNAVAQQVSAKPLQLQNDNVDLQKDRPSDKDNSHFSHNRHTALKAYLGLNSKEAAPATPVAKDAANGKENAVNGNESTDDKTATTKDIKEGEKKPGETKELTEEERKQIESMKQREAEVRLHENTHKSVGGHLASAPSYEYETGPDGKRYITGGHVNIDVSEEKDPKATIEKMQKVRAAALAPAQPSSADRSVAASAQQKENAARAQMREQAQEEAQKAMEGSSDSDRSSSADTDNTIKGNEHTNKRSTTDEPKNNDNEPAAPAVISKKLEGYMGV